MTGPEKCTEFTPYFRQGPVDGFLQAVGIHGFVHIGVILGGVADKGPGPNHNKMSAVNQAQFLTQGFALGENGKADIGITAEPFNLYTGTIKEIQPQ